MLLGDLIEVAAPTPRAVAHGLWLFGLLLGAGLGLLAAVLLALRYLRRSNAPPRARPSEPTPDPWLEAGRRVKEDDVT